MCKNLNMGALGHGGVTFEETCALAKAHGFDGVDLDMGDLARRAAASTLADAGAWWQATGLKPGGVGCGVKWRESDDNAAFEASLTVLDREAALARAIGATRFYTWVMPCSKTLDFKAHWNLVVPRLRKAAEILAGHGLSLGLEFVGPATIRSNYTYDFVHTMDGMLAMCAAIGPNTGLLLDCFHAYTAHASLAQIAKLAAADIVYVHVNDAARGRGPAEQIDNEREMVGATGVIDIAGFFSALRSVGYAGPVTVEPFNAAVRAMTPAQAAEYTGRALARAMAV
jgi:sugar phosphate isomerase/epimerase